MTKSTIRTTITAVEPGVVYMRCEHPFAEGETIERTFTVRRDGERGYVYENQPRGDRRQVCEKLAAHGVTLTADTSSLVGVIRREHRRARAADHLMRIRIRTRIVLIPV